MHAFSGTTSSFLANEEALLQEKHSAAFTSLWNAIDADLSLTEACHPQSKELFAIARHKSKVIGTVAGNIAQIHQLKHECSGQ